MPKRTVFLLSCLILIQAEYSGLPAGVVKRPFPAPEWAVSGWLNGDPGSLKENRNRVILIVSIHTVFEGHASQTPHRLSGFIREKKIHHPVGIDAYPEDSAEIPITMRRYRTGGTPNVTIIDKQGRVRFHHLGSFDPAPVEALIDRLLAEPGADGENAAPKRDLILSGE
ncbi:MAG: hypothetical protein O6947_07080 [Acidobacteria bacterium]|nr:hypothetical protein [Acidobacteriota bacterium]